MLSGLMYLAGGLTACLWVSTGLVLMAALVTAFLPTTVSGTGDGSVPGYEF
jgi:hypothetical protein